MNENRKTLGQLFFPIYLEHMLFMLTGTIDTLMLSSVGDQAVAAIGTANTYIGMFLLTFTIVSSGMMAVMTQYIGAGKPGIALQAKNIGVAFNGALGFFIAFFLVFYGSTVLDIVGIADALKGPATIYLRIVGGGCFLTSIVPIFSCYLRAFGHTKQPLIATLVGNMTNLILNAVFLYIFHMGVAGVAIATVISRIVNLSLVSFYSRILIHPSDDSDQVPSFQLFRQIVRIGFPAALESVLHNFAITLVMRFLNQMDAEGVNVAARSYTNTLTNFAYTIGSALSNANAIRTGWHIGAQKYDECMKETRKATIIGILLAIVVDLVLALSAEIIMPFFTDNTVIVDLVQKLIFIDIILEIGRVTNLIHVSVLQVSGDVIYPVVIATIFMYLCAVGGTYLFGIRMEMMVVGAYIGLALDECVRAIAMVLRWNSGIWKTKRIVK